jgi:ABC-type oligopeptide transport system ATPase subunit
MSNTKKRIELTKEQEEAFDKRILHVMLDSYSRVGEDYADMQLKNEIKIILETMKAGIIESRKINHELKDKYGDEYPFYHSNIEQFMMTCVAGKIINIDSDNEFIKETLHPYNIYGYRIKSVISAFGLLNSISAISSIRDEEFDAGSYNCDEALDVLKLAEDNEQ